MEHASSGSSRELTPQDLGVIAAAVLLGTGAYLLASHLTYRLGFPLDDSWIHATYARNLALHGEWAFRLGKLSAGSTAPLWTLLLTPGVWLHLAPLWWSYILGVVLLFGLGVLAERTFRVLVPSYTPRAPWVAVFFVAEWHMLWAATSGMETLLQALLATAVIALVMMGSRRYLGLGLLTGLSVWVRPDGVTLAGPVLLSILFMERTASRRLGALISYMIGLGSLFLPYLSLNLWLSGTPMPNTFYAKQAEYAAWQARPLLFRLGVLVVQLLTGPSIILVPGVVLWLLRIIKHRDLRMIAAGLWCGAYVTLYMLRLPAYQHGRYLMPAMPALFLIGLLGYHHVSAQTWDGPYRRLFQKGWQLALGLLTAGFVGLGAHAYGQDVGLIESEMVNTAVWVDHNVPPDAVVAAHDIGALGYFDDHTLIDLAGLISPEVVPFMRDEGRLAEFLDERGADYLIAFPDFYPKLTSLAEAVFSSGGAFAPAMGERNMTVYCWTCR